MILVGVDAGGTKTTVRIADEGSVLAERSGPSCAVRPGRAVATAAITADLIRSALAHAGVSSADVLVVGAAGVGREPERSEFRLALAAERIAPRLEVITDVEIAFAALERPAGIVLVAGTGSVAIARDPSGRQFRQGGYGWQMGDEGGGYWIGRAALNAASQAQDGRGSATMVLDLLANPKGGFDQLVSWSSTATVKEIAGLTSFVEHAAGVGDPVAQGILDRAAAELAALVAPLTVRLDDLPVIPVGLFGGLVASGGPLRARVMAALRQHPRVEVEEREITPVAGALLLARRLADAPSESTR